MRRVMDPLEALRQVRDDGMIAVVDYTEGAGEGYLLETQEEIRLRDSSDWPDPKRPPNTIVIAEHIMSLGRMLGQAYRTILAQPLIPEAYREPLFYVLFHGPECAGTGKAAVEQENPYLPPLSPEKATTGLRTRKCPRRLLALGPRRKQGSCVHAPGRLHATDDLYRWHIQDELHRLPWRRCLPAWPELMKPLAHDHQPITDPPCAGASPVAGPAPQRR